jgi:hypothetical protein
MASRRAAAARIRSVIYERYGFWPNPWTGITDAELDAAERALGIVLPAVYREFLHWFGSRAVPVSELYGLPRNDMRSDVVMRNFFDVDSVPGMLKIGAGCDGQSFYLDTARLDANGDCPVIVRDASGIDAEATPSFLDFLARWRRLEVPAAVQGGARV